jgi:GTPase SAR1 family protein
VKIILVGLKQDLRGDAEVLRTLRSKGHEPISSDDGLQLATKIGASRYVECSALTQKGLKTVFDEAVLTVVAPAATPQTHKGGWAGKLRFALYVRWM